MRKLLAIAISFCATSSYATEWSVLGARAQGMGGAAVALPNGAESAYWNPGALGEAETKSGLQVPFGAHMGLTGSVVAGAKDLNNVISACNNGGLGNPACNQANVNNALNELNANGNGLRADLAAGLGVKVGRLAVFANNFTFAAASPNANLGANVTAGTGGGTIVQNTSSLLMRGLSATEIGAAYGHEIPYVPGLFGGFALKGIIGNVGFNNYAIGSNGQFGGGSGNFSPFKNAQSGFQPSLDLGALVDVNRISALQNIWWRPRVGLTVHDINSPSFAYSSQAQAAAAAAHVTLPNRYVLQTGMRAGVAISPLSFWNVALDGDLTRNLTALSGVQSQMVALGTEINVFNRSWLSIPLRAGLSRNMALPGAKTALSAGAGFNFLHFNVDIGATVTPGTQNIQSQGQSTKLPNEVAVSGQLALLFGGAPELSRSETGQPVR